MPPLFGGYVGPVFAEYTFGESSESDSGPSGGDGDSEEESMGDSMGRCGLPGPMASVSSTEDDSE